MPSERGPPEHRQAEVYGRRIEGINISSEFKDVSDTLVSGFRHEMVRELFKDTTVAVLVGLGKVALCDISAKPQMVALAAMSLDDNNQVSKAFPIGQLSEHYYKQLVPSGEGFNISITIVLGNDASELVVIQKFNQLCENTFVLIHKQSLDCKETNSNCRARKTAAIN